MQTIGSLLKKTRIKKGISLETVAAKTRILVENLHAIETNQWTLFPAEIYAREQTRLYTQLLELPWDLYIAYFRRDYVSRETITLPQNIIAPSVSKWRFLLTYIFACGTGTYLLWQIYIFVKPPLLSVQEPHDGAIYTHKTTTVVLKGITDNDVQVTINETAQAITTDNGNFYARVPVYPGKNTFMVKATGANGRSRRLYITVTVPTEKIRK